MQIVLIWCSLTAIIRDAGFQQELIESRFMKNMSKHVKLNLLAATIAGVFSANAMSATDPEALAAAIAKQEAERLNLSDSVVRLK